MENEYFLDQHSSYTAMPTWQALSSAMEIQDSQLITSSGQSQDCFFGSNWERTMADPNIHFDSALSSMVTSPASNSNNISNESFVVRELIGKLGSIGNSGEVSPHLRAGAAAYSSAYNSANTSCYNTPLNSPPKLNLPNNVKEKLPKLPNSIPLNSCLTDFSADPGFAERAAKFSCFGSKSFNGRMNQFEVNNTELPYRSNTSMENGKLSRISSSPSIKAMGSQLEKNNYSLQDRAELASSLEESAVSEQKPNFSNDSTSRKRKAATRGKAKEPASAPTNPDAKVAQSNEDSSAKRCKPNDGGKTENMLVMANEEQKINSDTEDNEKQNKTDQKPPEAPKDYIHVRARRGQATDSHSLAERVRREKISERMKLLQDLVPGCNKVTGKAVMLDEIINYVQSLQRQVEFLSMKLASVNTKLDNNVDSSASKYTYQSKTSMPTQMFSLDSSVSAFYGNQPNQNPSFSANVYNAIETRGSVDHLDSTTFIQNLGLQLPPLNGLNESIPQYPNFCEDDLQAIVQMGFGKNPSLQLQSCQESNQASHKNVEL